MVTTYAFFAALLLLAAGMAAIVAWPLRKGSPRLFVALVVALALSTAGLYQLVGTPAALDRAALRGPGDAGPASLDEAIAGLRAELERNPAQPEGWILLARSHAMQQDHAKARDAFAQALKLLPDDAALLAEAAEARALADAQSRFDDEGIAMLHKAIAVDPANQRAPWFLGIAQRQRGDDAGAAATWEALLPKLDAGTAEALRRQIDSARKAANLPPLADATSTPKADSPQGLAVRVSLDPDFAARVRLRDDATVFVIARIADGPPMPVAVEKHPLQSLPLDIVLDDGDSPMPTQKLSALQEVEVFARISSTGNAMRQEGDIESAPVRVALPADAPVELVIGKPSP